MRSGAPDIFAIDGLTTEDLSIAHRDAADGRIGAIEGCCGRRLVVPSC